MNHVQGGEVVTVSFPNCSLMVMVIIQSIITAQSDPVAWLDSLWGRREYSWDFSDAFSVSSAAKINETDTFGPGDDDEIQFDDIADDDEDIDDVSWRNWTIFFLYILSTWI